MAPLRIVRKISRKRVFDTVCYEHERLFIPVPAQARDMVRPWLGRDLKVQVEPFAMGFAVLVYPEDRLLGLYQMSYRFRILLRQIEKESGVRSLIKLYEEALAFSLNENRDLKKREKWGRLAAYTAQTINTIIKTYDELKIEKALEELKEYVRQHIAASG